MKLYEIGTIITGNTPSKNNDEYYISDDIMFIKPGDIEEKYITNLERSEGYISEKARNKVRILPKDTVLVTCIGTIGKVGILEKEGTCNQQINAIIPNDMIVSKYLAYLIKSKQKILQLKANAPVVPIINKTDFSKIEINICDIKEQKRIVEKLDLVKKIIDIRQEQLRELNNIVKSQFVEMFGDIKIKEKMKNVSVYFSRGKTPNYVEKSNIKVISQACIYWDEFKYEKAKYQDENKALKSLEKMIENGDVLITSTGTGTLGRCNVYYGEEHKYMADSHVSILRLNYKEVNPIFFKYYFMQEKVQKELYAECVNGSTNQIELSKDRFLNFRILMPEITLQNQFSEIVKQIDKQKFEIEKSLKETQELYESLIEEYFNKRTLKRE